MDALAATFLAWIVSHTGLALPDHPSIQFMPRMEMIHRYYGSAAPNDFTLQALYDRSEHAIYFPQGWQPNDLRQKSALLHELVHLVQDYNKADLPCAAAYERQAFDLQILWLREQGVDDPYKIVGTNEFTIRVLSACPE